ncbi:hypothetical protein [uncultured Mediterranean phage uvDeep-CGR0-AD1-C123]|nr:hypothetical protein [uncultured Mediterranean phage uvDeep-CGR0-AD1-C123]
MFSIILDYLKMTSTHRAIFKKERADAALIRQVRRIRAGTIK